MTRKYTIKTDTTRRYTVDYRKELNDEQYAVVTAAPGPLLVIAGAGSGKTRTVTYRVARLLESGVNPEHILLVTFTNRAAREMLSRVELLVAGSQISSQARRIWGGTFHHIANRILRQHAVTLGYTNSYTILDAQDAKDLIDRCIQEAGVDIKKRRFPKSDLLQDIFSFAINTDQIVADVVLLRYPYFEPLTTEIEQVAKIYQIRKRSRNSMDYDDLLVNWKQLLEKTEIGDLYRTQFAHILVDEYQDTNLIQADIIDLLAGKHRHLMVVGDDAQSIYRWRGAHFENIYKFKNRYPDAVECRLETNYRSTPEVLNLANRSILHNRRQFKKQLKAVRSTGTMPALVPLRDVEQQSQFVASRILELRQEGINLADIVILYRAHFQSIQCSLELTKRGIPYMVRSGLRFFEQAHIKDVIAYLRLITNPQDELAWIRVLKMIPKIGKVTSQKIWQYLSSSDQPLALVRAGLFSEIKGAAINNWQEFVRLINALLAPQTIDNPAAQIELILASNYGEYLCYAYENVEARLEDLKQLANFARQYKSTEAFLSELTLINSESFNPPGGVKGEDIISGSEDDEKLTLSSIHQAKGLEWRVVFLIGCADGQFPTARSLRWDEDLEEERRLFYVALTRTQDELYVTYPIVDNNYSGQTVMQKPSRFITELATELFEVWQVEDDIAITDNSHLLSS